MGKLRRHARSQAPVLTDELGAKDPHVRVAVHIRDRTRETVGAHLRVRIQEKHVAVLLQITEPRCRG